MYGTSDLAGRHKVSLEADTARAKFGSSSIKQLKVGLRLALAERERAQLERHLAVGDFCSAMQEESHLRYALGLIEESQIWRLTQGYRHNLARWSR